MLKVLRNVAIIVLLALALTVLPGGGNVTTAVLTALSLTLLAAVTLLAVRFWRQNSLTRDSMTDRQRGIVYGGLGAIALMVAGTDEMFESGAGTVAWIVVMAVSIWMVFITWREAASV